MAAGTRSFKPWLAAFAAGFVSTVLFHQGVLALLHAAGAVPRAAWSWAPVPPFGVPSFLSLAFWGGLWGLPLWWLIRRRTGAAYWLHALLWGALLPSLVALFIVFPLKGLPLAGGWDPKLLVGALLLNGAWGLGVALFMRLMGMRALSSAPH